MQTCSLCQLLHVVTPGTGVRPGKQQKGMLVVHRETVFGYLQLKLFSIKARFLGDVQLWLKLF